MPSQPTSQRYGIGARVRRVGPLMERLGSARSTGSSRRRNLRSLISGAVGDEGVVVERDHRLARAGDGAGDRCGRVRRRVCTHSTGSAAIGSLARPRRHRHCRARVARHERPRGHLISGGKSRPGEFAMRASSSAGGGDAAPPPPPVSSRRAITASRGVAARRPLGIAAVCARCRDRPPQAGGSPRRLRRRRPPLVRRLVRHGGAQQRFMRARIVCTFRRERRVPRRPAESLRYAAAAPRHRRSRDGRRRPLSSAPTTERRGRARDQHCRRANS